jgi:uncharacterized membrane protein
VSTVGRSPEDDRLTEVAASLAARSTLGLLGGAAAAAGTLSLDHATGLTLPLDAGNASPLAATMVGALLTIAVFALWMRSVVVGLASGQLSPRVIASYLDDRFQRSVAGWMVAAISYGTLVALLVPSEGTGMPALSTTSAFLVVIAGLGVLLLAMRHAVNSLSPPDVIRSLADAAFAVLERRPAPDDPAPAVVPDPTGWWTLRSPSLGWVQELDHDALLEAVPPGTTVLLQTAVGEFVAAGETLAHVGRDGGGGGGGGGGAGHDEDAVEALEDAIVVARTRDARDDLAFAIQQLVDVAQHAVAPGSLDTSTAHEALVHLRAVLHEVLRHGTASGCRNGADGRRVVSVAAWEPADHLIAAFERLRAGAAQDPTSARHLDRTLRLLRGTAVEVGDERSAAVLDEQHERLRTAAARHEVPLTHR